MLSLPKVITKTLDQTYVQDICLLMRVKVQH